MFSLDANLLVYGSDISAGQRYLAAKQIIDDAGLRGGVGLTEQSLFEFFHAATRKGKIAASDAVAVVAALVNDFVVLMPQETVVQDALNLIARYNLSIWDARMLAVCNAHGCTHLLSEDMQDGAMYDAVVVLNPFNPANSATIAGLLTTP